MKTLKVCAIAALFSFVSTSYSEALHLDYKSFYSHLKKLDSEELTHLQFAFGFQHVTNGALCTIPSLYIHTDKQDIDIPVDARQRFVLPTEKALQLAQAKVVVELLEPANQCDLSVQLEVGKSQLPTQIRAHDLQRYLGQFALFFDEMGGFLSFMMPSPEGINIYIKDDVYSDAIWQQFITSEGKMISLNESDFELLGDSVLDADNVLHIGARMAQ